jgi:O-antigen/teichoic acid export membrane protein
MVIKNLNIYIINQIIINLINFVSVLIITNNFSLKIFGIFSFAQTIYLVLYSMSFSNYHYFLNYKLSRNFLSKNLVISTCLLISVITSILLYSILIILLLTFNFTLYEIYIILSINFSLIIMPFLIFYYPIFIKKKFKTLLNISISVALLALTLRILFSYYYNNIILISLSYPFECIILGICCYYNFKKNNNFKFLIKINYIFRVFKRISFYPFVALFMLISFKLDLIMISILSNYENTAYYSVPTRIVIIFFFITSSILRFYYPRLSENYGKKEYDLLIKKIISSFYIFHLLIFIIIFFIREPLLNLFDTKYTSSSTILLILYLNVSLISIYEILIQKKIIENKYKEIIIFFLISSIINISLNYFALMKVPIDYVAYSSVTSIILGILFTSFIYKTNDITILLQSIKLISYKNLLNEMKIIFSQFK